MSVFTFTVLIGLCKPGIFLGEKDIKMWVFRVLRDIEVFNGRESFNRGLISHI
jgi:hypothetical protein